MTTKLITNGFIAAGVANIGATLLLSKGLTNDVMTAVAPKVMSTFGLVMIMTWGLAYIAVAKSYAAVKWLVLTFAVEKLIYGVVWTKWILNNEVGPIFEMDTMAGIFYSIYGLNDWIFCVFFTVVFIQLMKKHNALPTA